MSEIIPIFIDIKNLLLGGISMGFVVAFYPSAFIIKYLKHKNSTRKGSI